MKNKYSKIQKKNLIQKYRISGLTQKDFCHENGLNHHTLSAWIYFEKQNLKPKEKEKKKEKLNFIPLEKDKFPWPKKSESKKFILTQEQVQFILSGTDPWKIKSHKELQYSIV